MRKDFFTPPGEGKGVGGGGGGEDRKRKLRKGLLRTEKRGRRERTEGWRAEREKRVGALVKAVRNADPFPRWPL